MKKLLVYFLVFCLIFGLYACGGAPVENSKDVSADVADESTGDVADEVDDDEDFDVASAKENAMYYDEYGNTIMVGLEGNKLTKSNVIRTGWQSRYTENGDEIYTRFILDFDAKYKQIFAINGLFDHSITGTYEVKGGKLYLYPDADPSSPDVYEYKSGNIVNNGHEFTPYFE